MTGKDIIREWINTKIGQDIDYNIIQAECPEWGFKNYGKYHTPESYTRYFRMVRGSLDVELVPVPRKWKTWSVIVPEVEEVEEVEVKEELTFFGG